jgi:hypothetical protein
MSRERRLCVLDRFDKKGRSGASDFIYPPARYYGDWNLSDLSNLSNLSNNK